MLTRGEDVEAHALHERGWSISAIARHLDRDRKTIRSYLNGERVPGRRRPATPDPLVEYEGYIRARFADDHNLWATALFDEVVPLGYDRSYPTFVRQIRQRGLRPHCEKCFGVKGRDTIEIDHPAGEEIQWDWFERRRAPWGGTAYVLLGTLPHSSRVRGLRRSDRGDGMSDNSIYQQARSHLSYLRLAAAAEALPVELDHAGGEELSHTAFLERLLQVEVAATEIRRRASLERFLNPHRSESVTNCD